MGATLTKKSQNEDISSKTIPNPPIETLDLEWLKHHFRLEKKSKKSMFSSDYEKFGRYPPVMNEDIFDRILGSLVGAAIGDALGAPVEFRPHKYMEEHQVKDFSDGGTWGLKKGQFTDDTSMTLCLASSLISCHGFNLYDQLVRYKWWFKNGYMSSTGKCFDIGQATKQAIQEFERRQQDHAKEVGKSVDEIEEGQINCRCGGKNAAGNGSLMRLAPVPLFFYRDPKSAVYYSGESSLSTHGDRRAVDSCRFYGALIVGALQSRQKSEILNPDFIQRKFEWLREDLCPEVKKIIKNLHHKRKGYENGIRGSGFVISSLEAALWAFANDGDSFEKGVLLAVNLGDDTDTTAAIYGQLAGAYYGYKGLPNKWKSKVFGHDFIKVVAHWIEHEGACWFEKQTKHNSMRVGFPDSRM